MEGGKIDTPSHRDGFLIIINFVLLSRHEHQMTKLS